MKIVKNHLNENPNGSYSKKEKDVVEYGGGYAFGYADTHETDDMFFIGEMGETHDDIGEEHRIDQEYLKWSGRIWPDEKVIAFWDVPTKRMLDNILYDISNSDVIYNGYNAKLLKSLYKGNLDLFKSFTFDINPEFDFSESYYSETGIDDMTSLVSYDNYPEYGVYTKEIIRPKHTDTPIEKERKRKIVNTTILKGYGSYNSKYQNKQKEKRYMTAENMKLVKENINQTADVQETLAEVIAYLRSFVYPNLSQDELIEFQEGLSDWIEKNTF